MPKYVCNKQLPQWGERLISTHTTKNIVLLKITDFIYWLKYQQSLTPNSLQIFKVVFKA